MTAPEGYQKGSFRGLPFVTLDHEHAGGRRIAVHEFPQSEDPVLEDLGKKAGRFSLNCHIRGQGYIARAKAFGEALNAQGVGSLIHPWLGAMQVGVDAFTRNDSTSEGGQTVFSIDFLESGLPSPAQPATDTQAVAKSAAADATDRAQSAAVKKFTVAGTAAFVEQAARDLAKGLAVAASIRAGLASGGGFALTAFQKAADLVGAGDLVRDPIALAGAVVELVMLVGPVGGAIDDWFALLDFGSDLADVESSTPARAQQADNQAAFVQLVNLAAGAQLVVAVADREFDSYAQAVALRDRAADRLDALARRQADLRDDDGADAFDLLRRALVADITARGGSLVRLQDYVPAVTEPAIVIAHRLYGAADLDAQVDALVARNAVQHPGFVPGGRALQVATPAIGGLNG